MFPFPGLDDSPMFVPATKRLKTFLPVSSLLLCLRYVGGELGGEQDDSSLRRAAELYLRIAVRGDVDLN